MTNRRDDGPVSVATPAAHAQTDPLRRTAQRYKRELPWADEEAIMITLGIIRARRVMIAATPRHIETLNLGVSLSGARVTLLLTLYFAHDRRLAQNRISREMEVSRTNITNLIDGLVKDDLVTRVTSPVDRRVSYAQLTPRGEELCSRLLPAMAQMMMDICSSFTDEEKVTLHTLLYRWQAEMASKYLDGDPAGE
jgi:MarR family 2-MHQ and catechol resistance regulon transcriptional repressor